MTPGRRVRRAACLPGSDPPHTADPSSVGENDNGTLTATAKKATASLALQGTGGPGGCIVVRQPGASVIPDC